MPANNAKDKVPKKIAKVSCPMDKKVAKMSSPLASEEEWQMQTPTTRNWMGKKYAAVMKNLLYKCGNAISTLNAYSGAGVFRY